MENNQDLLQKIRGELQDSIKPYQQRQNQRQKMIDFLKQCIKNIDRDNFFQLDEILKTKIVDDISNEEALESCGKLFKRLQDDSNEKVEKYRVQFIGDLEAIAKEVELPIEVDFPRFSVLKGIEGVIDFGTRKTVINKKPLKSIDPKRIVSAVLKIKRQLYDKPLDPKDFIQRMSQVYKNLLKKNNKSIGEPIPIQPFYLEYVLSLQSNTFFQDMDKNKFRGYSLDQFAVDIWRYFQSGIGKKSGTIKLSSGRGKSLWLIDSNGEKRLITNISFQGIK